MILAVSTSAADVQVAVWDAGRWVKSGFKASERNSSGAVMALIEELGIELSAMDGFCVDIGPGSFSGVKVGVTMVKTWAHFFARPVYAVSAFDLVDEDFPVAIGSKKGEVYYREPGQDPTVMKIEDLPNGVIGFYPGKVDPLGIDFRRIELPRDVEEVEALSLVPLYVAAPSISKPKQEHIMGETFQGG